jgi:hypothetical protein
MEHPPYSPDMAFSDIHILGSLKNALTERFPSYEHVLPEMQNWLKLKSQNFLSD